MSASHRKGARDVRVIAAVSAAHFYSHFGILVLPPLFPVLRSVYDVSYTELGLAVACLNLSTMLLQAPFGVLVDRVGAFSILFAGHMLMALSIFAAGLFDSYLLLLSLMISAGIGNAVYHPADYAVLSSTITPPRMGRAFSIHTAAGHFGFAAAPFLIVRFEALAGWQGALVLSGLIGAVIGLLLLHLRSDFEAASVKSSGKSDLRVPFDLLTSLPVLAALAFFTMIAISQGGLTGYSAVSLELIYELDLSAASLPLTLFLALSAIGVLSGGWIADRFQHHAAVCAGCYALMALLILPVALGQLPYSIVVLIFAVAGFANGFLSPARDLLVRSITPDGRAGVVFGFVTTGFNIGGLIAPVLFGAVMDFLPPNRLFIAVAIACLVTVLIIHAGQSRRESVA